MPELRICIDVDDVDRAVVFYRDVLGLAPGRRLGKHWVEMTGAPVMIDLLGTPPGTEATPAMPDALLNFDRHWTPVHLDFVVDDIDATVARALEAGATLDRDIQERPYGRMANMADPFGHGFCLLQMSARGYDALLDTPEE
jgi:predicted enzyme related to lactoylglutathione lyase